MVLRREKKGQNRPFLPLFWGRNARLASMFTKSWGAQSIEHLRNCGAVWGIASSRLLGQELQRFQIWREKIKRDAAFINDVFHMIPNFEPDSEDVQDHEEKRFRTSKPKYNWLEGQYESLYGVSEHCSGWFAHLLDQLWKLALFLKRPHSIQFGQLNAANRAINACILNIHGCLKVFGLPLNQSFFANLRG